MRVVLVCGDFRPARDGVAGYTQRLAAELRARAVDVVVASGMGDGVPDGSVLCAGWDLRGTRAAARALRRLDPDLVHLQFAPSAYAWHGQVGLLPALLGGSPPLVLTVHEYGWWSWPRRLAPLLGRSVWPRLERRRGWDRETGLLAPRAAAVVATNPSHARQLAARLPGLPVRTVPIGPNVAPTAERDRARPAVRARLGLPADAPLVVFFGFVHAVKGIRHLLEAAELLRVDHPGVHLVLAGGFDSLALRGREAAAYRAEVADRIAGHGLEGAVTVTGWQPDAAVSEWLAAADVAALPFTAGTTTKSGALLTCAEHGLPLVVTAAEPPDPALVDEETALLVPTRDGPALAKALARVLSDADLAARLAAGARRLAAGHGWGPIADAHVALYREVMR